MRFLLVIPPYVVDGKGRSVRPNKAMLPVGTLSIAAALLAKGHEVVVLDLVFEEVLWPIRLIHAMSNVDPDAVLVSCHTARNISVCRAVVTLVKSIQPTARIVFGGNVCVELGYVEFRQLGMEVDAVVRGYGHSEEVIDALVAKKCGDIRGPVTSNLPLPALHLLNTEVHKHYIEASSGRYPIIGPGGFGCLWSCNYCAAKMESRHVERSFDNMAQELDMAQSLGYTDIWAVDNLVTVDPEKCVQFDRLVAERGLKWSGMTRPALIMKHQELPSQLRACAEIAMAVESVDKEELGSWRRGAESPEEIRQAFETVASSGIATNAFVMLGGPQATEEGFWGLYSFLKELKLTTVSWSFFNPPASAVLNGTQPEAFGFYRWPMRGSLPAERVVQQAMVLSGTWWSGWNLIKQNLFFEDDDRFGVNFKEGTLYQERAARSPIGDLWKAWRMRKEVSR